jgi:hypothetical protein
MRIFNHKLILIAVLFNLLCSGCGSPTQPAPTELPPPPAIAPPTALAKRLPTPSVTAPPKAAETTWDLVVIGDSSLWGLGKAFAARIEKDNGVKVKLNDFALPALSAGAVLQALQTGKSPNLRLNKLPEALKNAEVVVMFVNPLDSVDPEKPLDFEGCFANKAPTACNAQSFEKYSADLQAIWKIIFDLRAGQPVILRATDIYNPLVSQWSQANVFAPCSACWASMNAAARQAAAAYNIPFLSRYDAFNGPNHDEDPVQKGYIKSDGEHPSDAASEYTAGLLSSMGYEPVPPPVK